MDWDFEERLRSVLDPLSSAEPNGPARASDFDLNPDIRPGEPRRLKPAAVLVPIFTPVSNSSAAMRGARCATLSKPGRAQ